MYSTAEVLNFLFLYNVHKIDVTQFIAIINNKHNIVYNNIRKIMQIIAVSILNLPTP